MEKSKVNVHSLKNGHKEMDLVFSELRQTVLILRAVNHDLRKKIIRLLDENEKMNVTDIYVKLRLEQSVASQHLAILRKAGIVNTTRDGKFIHYSLNRTQVDAVNDLVAKLAI